MKKIIQLIKSGLEAETVGVCQNWIYHNYSFADEKYVPFHDRLDEKLYWILNAIKNRLALDKKVFNPTNHDEIITASDKHKNRIENLSIKLDEMFNPEGGVDFSELESTQDKNEHY